MSMVDWDLAVATGTRLVRPGPPVSRAQAGQVVADLRRYAIEAQHHVRAVTGLEAETGSAVVAVIDRPGWIRANADGFRVLLLPLLDKLEAKRGGPVTGMSQAIGSRITAVETGSLLAFMASKVLGQYELFTPYGAPGAAGGSGDEPGPGRLLLVAPNIVAIEQELQVDPRDFRLWVCVHEETHRVQFGAVPWLRGFVVSQIQLFLDETDMDVSVLIQRLRAAVGAVGDAVRGGDGAGDRGGLSLIEAVQTPRQREILDQVTAVMSLLEGHADHVMDAVGPEVIPSVAEIREKFQRRRAAGTRLDIAVRRLLGLDAKMRQYRDGARFVSAVVKQVGMEGFNTVWTSPQTLPSKDEIADPARWVARVHGAH
jgi:coenzyme F420 biosynthesis associated uncharacterized protein